MDAADDPLNRLDRSLVQLGDLLRQVRPDQFDDPTPCDSWDVRTLIGHTISSDIAMYTARARREAYDAEPSPPDLSGDWLAAFAVGSTALVAAWRDHGTREPVQVAGDPLAQELAEFTLHAWDLAIATGQDVAALDPELADASLAWMRSVFKPEFRGSETDGKMFGPELEPAADAGPYGRLAAFSGRSIRP